jgi:hypothetical protein
MTARSTVAPDNIEDLLHFPVRVLEASGGLASSRAATVESLGLHGNVAAVIARRLLGVKFLLGA